MKNREKYRKYNNNREKYRKYKCVHGGTMERCRVNPGDCYDLIEEK